MLGPYYQVATFTATASRSSYIHSVLTTADERLAFWPEFFFVSAYHSTEAGGASARPGLPPIGRQIQIVYNMNFCGMQWCGEWEERDSEPPSREGT